MVNYEELITVLKTEIKSKYNRDEEEASMMINTFLDSYLKKAICDTSLLTFKDFYLKYACDSKLITYEDFTTSEIENIINETSLTDRDRQIATLRFIKLKSEEDIASILQIDKKTVHSNISKISDALKNTCLKLYKK